MWSISYPVCSTSSCIRTVARLPIRPRVPLPQIPRYLVSQDRQRRAADAPTCGANMQQRADCFNPARVIVPACMCGASALVAAGVLQTQPAFANDVVASVSQAATTYVPGLVGDSPLREGFVSAFLLIFFSEIGDKTFFIALLLALQRPRALVFAGTFGALAVMTVISVSLGLVLHELDELLPASSLPWDDVLAAALLVFFGIKTLQGASDADESAAEEKEEAEEVVAEMGGKGQTLSLLVSTFALVFAAEWGDKSFLATIALAAASSPVGVTLGGIAGHGVATGVAVAGGSVLSNYISERAVQYVGGSLFLVFAAATIFDIARGV